MTDVAKELAEMKESLDQMKSQKAQIDGAISERLHILRSTFDLEDEKAAEEAISALDAEIEKITSELNTEFEKLKADYEWE